MQLQSFPFFKWTQKAGANKLLFKGGDSANNFFLIFNLSLDTVSHMRTNNLFKNKTFY